MSRGAMAFLAGMGTGYINGSKRKQEQERLDRQDAQQTELHTAKMDGIKRENDDREALKFAGETVTARELEGPQPEAAHVDGQAQPIGYIAGNGASARTFASRGLAEADAVEQNKPEARRTRMADLAAQGNALAGTALTNDMQREASQITINKARSDEANRVFDTGVREALQANGPEGLAEFMSNSTADGKAGAVKFKAVVSPDGKTWQMHQVTGEGTTKPVGQAFANDENGHATAGFMLSRAVPQSEKVRHVMDVEKEKADQANKDRDFDLRKKESESTADYRKRTLAIQGAQEARAGALHKITMEDSKIPPAVKLQATTIAKQMEGIGSALNKAMAENNFDPQSDNAKRLLEQQASLGIQYAALLKDFVPAAKTGAGLPDASVFDKKPGAAPAAAPAAKPTARPAAAPAPTAQPAQQFNEAGYSDVQSTIDGAKRGDARARALLGVMIDQGVTTPAQRMQIYEISK